MIVIMRDAIMPDCCNTCVCSEGYGCGITGTIMTTKEMESRPDWCPLEEVEPCEDAVSRKAVEEMLQNGFPARGMWEIEGDVVKQTVCETLADALMDLEKLPSVTPEQPEPCELCSNLEKGDTLYQYSDWDGGIGFDYIWDIQFCPKCGRRLGDG